MVLQEMTIDLTCAEDIFQASSREEFSNALKLHGSQFNRPLLTECVRNLCAETPDPAVIVALHKESPLNLFTIATGRFGQSYEIPELMSILSHTRAYISPTTGIRSLVSRNRASQIGIRPLGGRMGKQYREKK